MYKTIKNFFDSEKDLERIVCYDFKYESPWHDVVTEENPIERWSLYRKHNSPQIYFDCDSCALAIELYSSLWGWSSLNGYHLSQELNKIFGRQWKTMGCDTMNSFYTIYDHAQKIYDEMGYNHPKQQANQNLYLQQLAALYHSIGNFTLIPYKLKFDDAASFNSFRGHPEPKVNGVSIKSPYYVCDFFDLSLKLIKENVSDSFFKKYIDIFCLNDYVDENYNIIPLFPRHKIFLEQDHISLEDPNQFLPRDEEELNEYLENVLERIKSRGIRIIEALKRTGINTQIQSKSTSRLARPKKQPSARMKKLHRWLQFYAACVIVVALITLFWVFSDVFGYINFADAVELYGLFIVVGSVLQAFNFDLILAILLFALLLLLLLKLFHFCLIRFANKRLKRCENCKKLFALNQTNRMIVKTEEISILVELEDRGARGDVTGTHQQYIPGTRTTYQDTYQCKFCGCSLVREKQVDTKNI